MTQPSEMRMVMRSWDLIFYFSPLFYRFIPQVYKNHTTDTRRWHFSWLGFHISFNNALDSIYRECILKKDYEAAVMVLQTRFPYLK